MNNKYFILVLILVSVFSTAQDRVEEQAIANALDKFHQAAAKADAQEYLGSLTNDAIFLGTDSTERWTKEQFSAYVLPRFKKGRGWLYVARERNITLLENSSIAFFDEILENDSYGRCRGSGILIKTNQGWKISQYNLSVSVPNNVADKVIEQIKQYRLEK